MAGIEFNIERQDNATWNRWLYGQPTKRASSSYLFAGDMVLVVCIILLCVFLPLVAVGQFVHGNTVDARNQPLPYALIYLSQEPGGIQSGYAMSDSLGYWKIALSKPTTYKLVVRYLGCKQRTHELDWNGRDTLYFFSKLEVDSLFLKEILVKDQRPEAIIIDDTIRYPAHWYADSTEISLGDLINKIPGASYSPQEGIIYGGRRVDKIFIEQRDLFLDQHHLAADGVPARLVEALDFNINYQALRNQGSESEYTEVALNIRLNEKGQNAIMGILEGEGGLPCQYKGAGSILRAGKRNGFSVFGRLNNMGISLMSNSEYAKLVPSINRYILKNAEHMIQSGTWDIVPNILSIDDRVKENSDIMLAGVYEYAAKPDRIMRFTGYASQIRRNRESYLYRTYFSNAEHILAGQNTQQNAGSVFALNGHSEWQFNPKLYLEVTIPVLKSTVFNDGALDGQLTGESILFSGNHKLDHIDIAPEFYLRYKLNNKFTFRFNGFYQNQWQESGKRVEDIIPILDLAESAHVDIFRFDQISDARITQVNLELGCQFIGKGPLSYQIKITGNHITHHENSMSSLPMLGRFDGVLSYLKGNIVFNPEGIYESKLLMGKVGIRLYSDQLILNSMKSTLMATLPYLSLRYNLSKFHYILFKINDSRERPEPSHVWDVEKVTDSWLSTLGQYDINESIFSRSVNMTYNRIAFYPALRSLIVGGSYTCFENSVTQIVIHNSENQFQAKWLEVPKKEVGNLYINYQSKLLSYFQMNGRLQWNRTYQEMLSGGPYSALKNDFWLASFRFNVTLNRNAELGLKCQFTRSNVSTFGLNSLQSHYQSLVPGINMRLNINSRWTFTTVFSTFFNLSSSQDVERFYHLNMSITYRPKSVPIEFSLNGYNVFNVFRQALLQVETNPVYFDLSSYMTFPSMATIGARWYFP